MVISKPSKVLSGWSYESKPRPLRSSRTAGEFCETEVPDTDDEKSDFQEFSKLLLNGQKIADDTKKTYVFMWRGYKACISGQLPKLSSYELERRYKLAMESIQKMKVDKEAATQETSEGLSSQLFKKPIPLSSSSSSMQSSSSSDRPSSQSLLCETDEVTQIPETQFDMESKLSLKRFLRAKL